MIHKSRPFIHPNMTLLPSKKNSMVFCSLLHYSKVKKVGLLTEMWNEDMYKKCLAYFRDLQSSDRLAEGFVWLLEYVGVVPMYENVRTYNRVIEVVLTQRIKFKKSGSSRESLQS